MIEQNTLNKPDNDETVASKPAANTVPFASSPSKPNRASANAIRRTRAYFKSILDGAPDAIIVTDSSGLIVYINNQMQTIFGFTPRQLYQKSIGYLIPARYVSAGDTIFKNNVAQKIAPTSGQYLLITARNKKEIPVSITLSVVDIKNSAFVVCFIRTEAYANEIANSSLKDKNELYKQLVANLNQTSIIVFDTDLRIQLVDGKPLSYIGYKKEETEGRLLVDVATPEVYNIMLPYYKGTLEGSEFAFERTIVDKPHISYSARFVPLRDRAGIVVGGMIVVKDLTEQRDVDLKLKDSQDFANRIYTQSIDMLGTASFDGVFVHLNPAWETTLGWTIDELKSKPFVDFVHPDDRAITAEEAQKIAHGETKLSFENRYQCKDGSYRWISWNSRPDYSRRIIYFVARDITQQKQMIEELKEAQLQAEEASRLKTHFLATMSHELRTPLNAIIGFSDLLLKEILGEVPSEQREYITDIQNNGKHLLSLINSILDLTKIESGQIEFDYKPVNIPYVVEHVRRRLHPLAAQKRLYFSTYVDPSVPVFVVSDEVKLKQILINLIGNAIKFTETGGVNVKVDKEDDEWVIVVSDTGIGIPQEELGGLFEEFHQLDTSLERKYEGTGLGLSITCKLVTNMNGRLEVTSKLGKGSVFTVRLPLDVEKLKHVKE